MPKISKTSKMKVNGKTVKSFSLPAGSSCPGSKGAEVCGSCYAKSGFYHIPVVKNVREHNKEVYKQEDFVSKMIKIIGSDKYFRFFDSGDIETPLLAAKLYDICKACPNTQFWIPTRSDMVSSIQPGVSALASLPNVALRLSANNIGLSKPERAGVSSYVIPVSDIPRAGSLGIHVCPATTPGTLQKSCDTCTACYTDAKVAYVIH